MSFRLGKRRIPLIVAVLFLATPPVSVGPEPHRQAALQEAKHLAWLNNWIDASRILDRLESSGLIPADEATKLFSRAAHIRGNIESMPLPDAAEEVASMLDSGSAQGDFDLRIQLLAIKGDIEFQYSLPAAQQTWEEARQLAFSRRHGVWTARAEGELGTIAFLNGQIFNAVRLVSGTLLKAELSKDVAAQIRYRTALGEGLKEFGRTADAIRFFDKALALSAETPGAYFPFTAYLGKARLLATTGRAGEGLRMLHTGLDVARRSDLKVREARILTVLGELAVADNKRDEAATWLTAAADVAKGAGLDRIEADASSALASLLREIGKTGPAAAYARRSVAAARRARDLYHLPQMVAVLAEIETSDRNFRQAEAAYAQATDLVDALLKGFPHPRHKNTLIATMGRVFQGHFELALNDLHDPGKAFRVLESAKARGLVDLLQRSNSRRDDRFPWDARPARQIAALQRDLSTEENSGRRAQILDRIWELEVRSFRAGGVSIPSQEPPGTQPVAIQRLQSSLSHDELVIEYVLGPARSFALAISRDDIAHYELKGRSEIESAVESHLATVRNRRDGRTEARALYRLLLQPIALFNRSKRVVVVPDGKLHLVAFGALVDSKDLYVVETHIISYAPSATGYYLLSRPSPPKTAQMALLGVGGASYKVAPGGDTPSALRGFGFFDPSGPPRWSPIPQSLTEVSDVAAFQSGKTLVLTGNDATEADLKRLPLAAFRVLHLALHSTIDEEFPDRSALVLSSRPDDADDGLLQAREILALKLNADLVTLSACDGGAGTIEGLTGINSLVQAFLMAGSRSVVASVWPADDMFTAALMRRFYAKLRQGFDKAEALTLAKRELLRRNGPDALPFYWAGFRLVGDSHGTVSGE